MTRSGSSEHVRCGHRTSDVSSGSVLGQAGSMSVLPLNHLTQSSVRFLLASFFNLVLFFGPGSFAPQKSQLTNGLKPDQWFRV